MTSRSEHGYVLLTMLVLLLSVGGGWMSHSRLTYVNSEASHTISVNDQHSLVQARQSLISYAALYPYLYGPTGAGPAHLPCPDTDGYRERGSRAQSGQNQSRDGSDPPCASQSGSDGLLPRHTVLPGHRYLFHSQPWQRFEYRVAGHMINNPLNRVVNLQGLVADAQEPVATISLPLSDDADTAAHVTIRGRALVNATVASVAAWVIQRTVQTGQALCSTATDDASGLLATTGNGSVETCSSPVSYTENPSCQYDEALAIVLDRPFVFSGECLLGSLESNTIERVSALRHWYIRNGWYRSLQLSYHEGCSADQLARSSCVLFASPELHKATILPGMRIELYWAVSE
ncbi:MAG: hypothetical protein AB8B64_09460 [Granulosicoccus sp.]